jgi:DNA replication protein DnaC
MKTKLRGSDPERPSLEMLLRQLKLPSFAQSHEEAGTQAEKEGWTFRQYLHHLAEVEVEDRRRRRIERNLKHSHLPADKTLGTLDTKGLPRKVKTQLPGLCEGSFVERAENVLAFGLPGRGKSHTLAAIGHELIQRGYRVLYRPAFLIVQQLLVAKRELELDRALRRLDAFDVVVIDDIGYVQQSRDEMEVLFTFLSERYERRSVMITSNLVFSEWDKIFKDPMTTAAAIDRVVHHATILELTGSSYRTNEARKRNKDLNVDDDNAGKESNEK